ncbi:MAG: hypothetical protein HYT78_13275 [Deltaproteobacteria bacterium]|nr:hypothetical protein [Deltaproteobacteria bacterium]
MKKSSLIMLSTGIATFFAMVFTQEASAIPAFARKYKTSCLTCHVMPPKLNAFGEAFRLNGYQIPDGDEPHIKDEPLVTAAPAWKEAWPQANWPGWIPGSPPIALRLQVDTQSTKDETQKFSTNFEFPHEVELLWGGTFGEDLGFFGEVEWKQRGTMEVKQGFLKFQNPLGWLGVPRRWLNLWVGQMDQVFLTSYRNLDRTGVNHPLWGNKKPSDFTVRNLTTGATRTSGNAFRLQDMVPGIEFNGILGSRLFWATGVTTGGGEARFDIDNHKDPYYKVRYKLGGRAYDGSLPGERGVSLAAPPSGAWVDNALQIEHFGYFGKQRISTSGSGAGPGPSSASRSTDSFNRFGLALRWTWQDLDLAGGLVWGQHEDPWGSLSEGKIKYSSPFARLDYMIFPWWMAQLRFEDLHVSSPKDLRAAGFTAGSLDQTRFIPALIFLIRANLRFVLEGELYTKHKDFESRRLSTPHAFWTRFDYAF